MRTIQQSEPLDVITDTLNILTSKRPLSVMVVTVGILTMLYWLMKPITLGLKLRIHHARQGLDILGWPQSAQGTDRIK
jgi:uncharacterized membrane protein